MNHIHMTLIKLRIQKFVFKILEMYHPKFKTVVYSQVLVTDRGLQWLSQWSRSWCNILTCTIFHNTPHATVYTNSIPVGPMGCVVHDKLCMLQPQGHTDGMPLMSTGKCWRIRMLHRNITGRLCLYKYTQKVKAPLERN